MSVMSITRDEVTAAYQLLLGRMPESEKAYAYGLSAGSVQTLRRWIMNSPEFEEKLRRDAPNLLARWVSREIESRAASEDMPASAEEKGPPRIVFIHIMKTAGNSLRRRLESLVPDGTVWPEPKGRLHALTLDELSSWRLIAGHITAADAMRVPGPKRVFTVLRDPKDRLVSLYRFWSRHREEYIEERDLAQQRIARSSTLLEFLRNDSPAVNGVLHNAMTCVLAGDFVSAGDGTYRHRHLPDHPRLSPAELLQRALKTVLSLDYVAFVDRLERDRPKLMRALGLPDTGPLPKENTRERVDHMLEPARDLTITPDVDRELHRLTDLDRMLYRLARAHWR